MNQNGQGPGQQGSKARHSMDTAAIKHAKVVVIKHAKVVVFVGTARKFKVQYA